MKTPTTEYGFYRDTARPATYYYVTEKAIYQVSPADYEEIEELPDTAELIED